MLWKMFITGFIIAGMMHLITACPESTNPSDDNEKPNVDVNKIHDGAQKVEEVFLLADTTQLKEVLTPTALERYQIQFPDIAPKMEAFASAFKERKLVIYSERYAEYEFEADGKKFNVAFARQDDDSWKMMRF